MIKKYLSGLLILFLFQSNNLVFAQSLKVQNPDSTFISAKVLAFEGKYQDSRDSCNKILQEYPSHFDALNLVARTYAWEKQYDTAKTILHDVLEKDEDNFDALLTLIDIAIWEKQYEPASEYIEAGLRYHPGNQQIIAREEKLGALLDAMVDTTENAPLKYQHLANAVLLDYRFDYFREPYIRRWHVLSAGYRRNHERWKFEGRINLGKIFLNNDVFSENTSQQLDFTVFRDVFDEDYIYLNYGKGWGNYFPRHRFGAEYFKSLPEDFEASLGSRYLVWEEDFFLFTASVAKYIPQHWISFRTFYSPFMEENFFSAFLTIRRYLDIENSYVFLMLGTGDSPDQPANLVSNFGRFSSQSARLGVKKYHNRWLLKFNVGYLFEEFAENTFRNRFEVIIGTGYAF
jgi:YaiO family outer membrane protein